MKMIRRLLTVSVLLACASAFGSFSVLAADPGTRGPSDKASPAAAGPKSPRDASEGAIIVRGWQIQAVTAIKRATVSEIFPEYVNRKPVGNHNDQKKPKKDKYLVVLVQSQPATLQSLNEPLWIGQPDVTLVDDVGFEYPALGRLVQVNGDYVTVGMVAGRNRPKGPRTADNSLVYFDVPANAHNFWLKFSEGGPLIAATVANDLPVIASE